VLEAELFEVDETFFWMHRLGTHPVRARSLGLCPHVRRTLALGRNWFRWIHLLRQGARHRSAATIELGGDDEALV
jgi:hypothetical protein